MRHVARTFLESTLGRGATLEQFLGGASREGERTIRVLELHPRGDVIEVWLHEAVELGDEERLDYYPFIFLGDGDGNEVGSVATFPSAASALEYAQTLGVHPDRWTNAGVSQDEYRDFIRAGRPTVWPVAN